MVEVPKLLEEDTSFRNFLLGNIRVKPYIKDFWYNEFDRLTRRDRTEQVGPVFSCLYIFRSNSMIRHIVGQTDSTVDFSEILNGEWIPKIVLLRMPTHLSNEVKTLIGTMLVSEILSAVFARDQMPEGERRFFGLYCDEFQDFATPDFAKLFTQTGKYKVMPVVAHHERVGQFTSSDPNRGATLAAPNKVLFHLSVHDATELALEFAEKPLTEARREQELVVCQDPVSDLLRRPHRNPETQAFVNKYLRPLQERRSDAREDMEGERLIRMDYLDEAGLLGTTERVAGLDRLRNAQLRLLEGREAALRQARLQTGKLYDLFDRARNLRLTLRGLDRFCAEIMEGRRVRGQEPFSEFLIGLVHNFAGVEKKYRDVLELYIALSYGDPNIGRTIPFDLARSQALFSDEVTALTRSAEKKTEEERQKFQTTFIPEEEQKRARVRMIDKECGLLDTQRAM